MTDRKLIIVFVCNVITDTKMKAVVHEDKIDL
jgi:hypothetical protein